jgi:hypothetical protein
VAAMWRLMPLPRFARPLQNKYLIWSTLGLIIRHLRPQFPQWSSDDVSMVFRGILVMVVLLGCYKTFYGYSNSIGVVNVTTKKTV